MAASCLTGVSAWFFRPLLQLERGEEFRRGVLFLTAALLLGLQDLELLGLSLGRAAQMCIRDRRDPSPLLPCGRKKSLPPGIESLPARQTGTIKAAGGI